MLYLLVIAAAVIVSILFKGRIYNLSKLRFKRVWLVFPAFIIQVVLQVIINKGYILEPTFSLLFQGISYGLLLFAFWFNRGYFGILTMGAGCFLNALVIMLNGGKMPVSAHILNRLNLFHEMEILRLGLDSKHSLLTEGARLAFLADVIYLPYFPGIGMRIVSIGDLVTAAGLFIFVFEAISGIMIGSKKLNFES
jgi:hypothetical protein